MRKNSVSPFIQLIWDIVSDPQTDSIISWNAYGTSFQIINPDSFCEEILKRYFKHTNISSFIRQLNMYNFHKNKANITSQQFYHKLFRRDARQLLIGIKRKPSQADYREGQQLLRIFLSKRYENQKEDCNQEQCKQEASQQTPNDFSYDIHNLLKSRLTGLQQNGQICNSSLVQQRCFVPKKIFNIIIVGIPQN